MKDIVGKIAMWVMGALMVGWLVFMLWMAGMWARAALFEVAQNFWGILIWLGVLAGGLWVREKVRAK